MMMRVDKLININGEVTMLTTAVRLYGKNDLRLEQFELPKINDDEILAQVITDSICFSTWKEVNQGADHKKVPNDVATNPIIIGHEFCGNIIQVGKKWQNKFNAGERFVIQANLQLANLACPGYSFPTIGGEATYIVIPKEVMEQDCLLAYHGNAYFEGSMIEPLSCVIGAFNANYHLIEGGYNHKMGIKPNGNLVILGGAGPMGMLAIDYALHGPIKPKRLVITGQTQAKLDYCKKHYPATAETEVFYINIKDEPGQVKRLKSLTNGEGYDDVFVFYPSEELVNIGSRLLTTDGCLNFFAGPQDPNFMAQVNFYDIHYAFTHYVGTSGGNTDDMREGIRLIEQGKVSVNKAISHILGLDHAADVTVNQSKIGGAKKVVYSQKLLPLIDLSSLLMSKPEDHFLQGLQAIVKQSDGLWSKAAEDYLLQYAPNIQTQ